MAPSNLHTTHAPDALNWVWDPVTGEWLKMTQPGGSGGGATTIADGADVAQGTTTDPAWVSGDGTVISLLKKLASAGGGSAVSIADGSDVAEGVTTDAAVVTDVAGTVSGKLRGLVKIFASVWDSANGLFRTNPTITRSTTKTFTTAGDVMTLSALGLSSLTAAVTSGTNDGNLFLQGSSDNGTTWTPIPYYDFNNPSWRREGAIPPYVNYLRVNCAGYTNVRIFQSGTPATSSTWAMTGSSAVAPGVTGAVAIAGVSGDLALVDASGRLEVIVQNTVGVSGAFFQATQPVSLAVAPTTPVTNAGLSNLDVLLSTRTKPADQQHVIVDSSAPVAVTGAFFQATQPVSLASPVAVTGTFVPTATQVAATWNAATALNTQITIPVTGMATGLVTVTRTGSLTSGQITLAVSNDGTNFYTLPSSQCRVSTGYVNPIDVGLGGGTFPQVWTVDVAGWTTLRARLTTAIVGAIQTVTVTMDASAGGNPTPLGVVPVSGTVTASQGNNSNNASAWWTRIGDSVNGPAAVKPASTAAVATDPSLVVALHPTSPLPAGTAVIGHVITDTGSTMAVTGTVAVSGTFFQATQPVSIAAAVAVTPPTLTKGTQGATGFSVQDLRDAGRNTRIFMLDAITAAPLVEALATVVQWYGNAAVAGTTTPAVVPAGKTLRLTGYKIMYQSLATVGYAVVRIRVNTAGVAVLASPLVASFEAGSGSGATTAAMTGGVTTETGSFPEGLEIPAAAGIGFSVAGYGPTGTLTLEGGVRFEVHGYEY